jgi:hypothetical protein
VALDQDVEILIRHRAHSRPARIAVRVA